MKFSLGEISENCPKPTPYTEAEIETNLKSDKFN